MIKDLLKLPNLLSISRLIMIPVFVGFFLGNESGLPLEALLVLAASFITDVADGMIARKFGLETEIGKILDPLADKAMQTAVMLAICIRYPVSIYIFILVLAKELAMGAGTLYLKRYIKTPMISANKWGKIATGSFYLSVAAIIAEAPNRLGIYCLYITLALMAIAFASYLKIFIKLRNEALAKSKANEQ
ncbi:MAG: CDP-alcohol phosphatidyltransferase family protein [Eubacteriaceae bacterium]|nr:CDP-alcohol phosphatidyltransferase family protein [Eubacteriaceae bacterium]